MCPACTREKSVRFSTVGSMNRSKPIPAQICLGCPITYTPKNRRPRKYCPTCVSLGKHVGKLDPETKRINYNKRQREYHLKQYHRVRSDMITRLGGRCASCGYDKNLEIDHRDRELKDYDISKMWALSSVRLEDELAKCQILCEECHKFKSITERGLKPAKNTHGTISSYRYCHCSLCRAAKAEYTRNYRSK